MSQLRTRVAILVIFVSLCIGDIAQSFPIDEYCRCHGEVSTASMSLNVFKFLDNLLADYPKPVSCVEEAFHGCRNYCYKKVAHFTNDFSLSKPLTGVPGHELALGQLLCNTLGRDLDGATVSLRPQFHCSQMTSRFGGSTFDLKDYPGQPFAEKLTCRNGKVQPLIQLAVSIKVKCFNFPIEFGHIFQNPSEQLPFKTSLSHLSFG
ncbi:hypothetical protein HDE_09824 [Halotydeus destructor]|nr:hypothetical protein HDE_09824 [Halotydeus destructor]